MVDAEMNKGVLILLERMGSHPEEFLPDLHGNYPHKWRGTLSHIQARATKREPVDAYIQSLPFLTDAEIITLWAKMQSLRRDLFTKQVMNTLLQESFSEELSTSSTQSKNVTTGRLRYP
jgi:hypothetical protein